MKVMVFSVLSEAVELLLRQRLSARAASSISEPMSVMRVKFRVRELRMSMRTSPLVIVVRAEFM